MDTLKRIMITYLGTYIFMLVVNYFFWFLISGSFSLPYELAVLWVGLSWLITPAAYEIFYKKH